MEWGAITGYIPAALSAGEEAVCGEVMAEPLCSAPG